MPMSITCPACVIRTSGPCSSPASKLACDTGSCIDPYTCGGGAAARGRPQRRGRGEAAARAHGTP